ncbi:hypothetical protein HK097_000014 [Rhizophlyctis rosea]|uniref:Uncharacterized protein n=1 Tax=Rhizophlyctis rosea TaxID=64517 RepID=A0AAD5SKU7_9FUNG|nr:hypothetical protein HK097_000014 [Rhizophlyctis rosea]
MAMSRASHLTMKSGVSFHSTTRGFGEPVAPTREDSKTWFLKVFGDSSSQRTSTALSRASSNENLLKSTSDNSSIQYLPDSDLEDDLHPPPHHQYLKKQFTSDPHLVRTSEDTERITSREIPVNERKALYLVTSGYASPHASIRTDATSSQSIGPESMLSYGVLDDDQDPFRDPDVPPRNRPTSALRPSSYNSSPPYPHTNPPFMPSSAPTFPVSLLKTLDMASARRSAGDDMSIDTLREADPDEASTETMSSKTSSIASDGGEAEPIMRKSYASEATTEPMSRSSYVYETATSAEEFPDYPTLTNSSSSAAGGVRNSGFSTKTLVPVRRDSEDTLTRPRDLRVEKIVRFDVNGIQCPWDIRQCALFSFLALSFTCHYTLYDDFLVQTDIKPLRISSLVCVGALGAGMLVTGVWLMVFDPADPNLKRRNKVGLYESGTEQSNGEREKGDMLYCTVCQVPV